MNLDSSQYSVAFQSRLGKEPWIQPFSDVVVAQKAKAGIKKLPATLEEIVGKIVAKDILSVFRMLDFDRGDVAITSPSTGKKVLDKLFKKDHYFPQTFEKDDDTNWHVKWITSASNCRAELYNIESVSEFETKGIAGKIIPAVATTTSTIVGLISIELMKFVMKQNKVEDYKSYFVNLSDNTFIGAEPMNARIIKIGEKEFNQWDKLSFKATELNTIDNNVDFYKKLTYEELMCLGW